MTKIYTLGERTLKLKSPHMRGNDVSTLQTKLNAFGFDCGKADGIFGTNTEKAVKAFQKKAGITSDGIVGSATAYALTRYDSKPSETPSKDYESIGKQLETALQDVQNLDSVKKLSAMMEG